MKAVPANTLEACFILVVLDGITYTVARKESHANA